APRPPAGRTPRSLLPRPPPPALTGGGPRPPAAFPVPPAGGPSPRAHPPPPPPPPQPTQSPSPPVLPQPSPAASAAPPTALPQPAPAQSTSSQQITPGGTLQSPIATPTPTPTPTSTPTPTATATPTPTSTSTTRPPGTLCLRIQTLNSVSSVDPHTTVRYAIWVWLSSGTDATAKVTLSASPSSVSPTFSVCASSGRTSCKFGLNAGHNVQLRAKLKAPGRSHHHVTLTATATSSQASNS